MTHKITQAAANKAAEEIERKLFEEWAEPLGYPMLFSMGRYFGDTWNAHRGWMARASRQVANKAEVEPAHPQFDASKGIYWFSVLLKCARLLDLPDDEPIPSGVLKAVEALVATPPATTGASTAPVETFIELRNRVADLESQLAEGMRQTAKWAAAAGEADGRNYKAREVALEEAARHFEQAPFDQAKVAMVCSEIRALKASVGASTVLTNERIATIDTPDFVSLLLAWETDKLGTSDRSKEFYALTAHIDRHVAREVAAQAGQVAVPDVLAKVTTICAELRDFYAEKNRHELSAVVCALMDRIGYEFSSPTKESK